MTLKFFALLSTAGVVHGVTSFPEVSCYFHLSLRHSVTFFLTCIRLTARLFHMTLVTAQVRDVTPGPLTVTDTCIMYHDEFRCFSKRYSSYALRKHMCGRVGCGLVGKQ
jgi:hypothetical protein